MKERNKTPKDTNGIRIGVVIFTVALIVSLLVVAYISQKNPNTDFITTISGIGTFATALLTALYVYTTTQQISIANNQLAEMKHDRITQEQPLVVVDCEKFNVNPPKMYYSPPENEYSFCSQYYYEAEIKNESSFAAISVDVTSEMLIKTDEGKKVLHSSSKRIKTLSAGQQIKIGFLFLDEGKYSVYTALRQMKTKELPTVKTTIIYKNLCGAYFKVNSYSSVFPSKEDTQQLIAWHTSITTATTASKEIIGRMLTLPLNDPDRKKMFNNMKEAFDNSFENDVVLSIDCEEEPLGFEIVVISKEEFEEILSKHGYARRIRGFDDCSVAEK
ncbi:MAG: hypothetical protein UEP57_04135 [Oscillospiraceae bacterium]|nr:hypothetical protein [Oscillospiraceae bacterium]